MPALMCSRSKFGDRRSKNETVQWIIVVQHINNDCTCFHISRFEKVERCETEGTKTGKPRRVGWLDLPVVRYRVELAIYSSLLVLLSHSQQELLRICNVRTRQDSSFAFFEKKWPRCSFLSLPLYDYDLCNFACSAYSKGSNLSPCFLIYIDDNRNDQRLTDDHAARLRLIWKHLKICRNERQCPAIRF